MGDTKPRAKRQSNSELTPAVASGERPARSPLVFISHDSRDHELAKAFADLLTDASGGFLQSFYSSDRKGKSGIEYGDEWYRTVMEKLDQATDVVALLTPHSLNRPWILYESGVAKGKLNTPVLGVALGVELGQASTGPFAQFQNCGDDADSLTKLVLQLITRNSNATPREEAVRRQATVFITEVQRILQTRGKPGQHDKLPEQATVAQLFEEIKILIQNLPVRLGEQKRVPTTLHGLPVVWPAQDLIMKLLPQQDSPEHRREKADKLLGISLKAPCDGTPFADRVRDYHAAVCDGDESAIDRTRTQVLAAHPSSLGRQANAGGGSPTLRTS